MWAFSIDDRTLLCLAVNVTKRGISRNNFKFSKTVACITYISFSSVHSHKRMSLQIGGLAVCGYGSVFFHHEVSGGRGMAWLTFLAMHKSQSARNSRCISTVVPYFRLRTQPGAFAWACNNLPFLFSSVIELSTLTCTSTTTMFECLDMDFCKTGTCSGLLCWGKCSSGAKHI